VKAKLTGVALACALAGTARAEDGARHEEHEHVSRTPNLPDLQHRDVMGTVEWSGAAFAPGGGAWAERFTLEVPAAGRGWQIGVSYSAGGGRPPAGALAPVSANTEIWGRGEWVETTGLAFGGGLAIALPTSLHQASGRGARAANLLVSTRPWDAVLFDSRAFAVRPFIDMRAVRGRFVLQFRQRIDLGLNVIGGGPDHTTLSASIGLAASYRIGSFNAGLEAWQLYFIERETLDGQRSFFSLSPFLCAYAAKLEPCVSLLTNVDRPVSRDLDRVYVLRVGTTVVFE
jgi:hypothetical protein